LIANFGRWPTVLASIIGVGIFFAIPAIAAEQPPAAAPKVTIATPPNALPAKVVMPDGIYVRIIVFGHAFKQEWDLKDHTAQDVLKLIEQLKPNVLNRFIDGKQNPDLKVPVDPGCPEMTELEFLKAAMNAGAPGCTISPKVHLNDIWSDDYRMQAAQSLRDLPLTPRLTMLDLDSWFSRPHDAGGNKAMLEKFKDMGWTTFVTNPGPYKSLYGCESSVMTYMSTKAWQVPKAKIEALHRKGIALPLLHIDYPSEINVFRGLPGDRQADIIKNIQPEQTKLGFRFIYPILSGHYDSTRIHTSQNGPYHGASLFEVMKQMIELDRKELADKGMPAVK
jgi:hypothetical protein